MADAPDIESLLTDDLVDAIYPHWNNYIAQVPFPRQVAFLMLPNLEAFFGGAAGGSKTSTLCMAALQYADVPGYNGVIFRKTYTDHQKPSSPGARIAEWLSEQAGKELIITLGGERDAERYMEYVRSKPPGSVPLGVSFDSKVMQYTFYPSRATLTLGNMGDQWARFRYQGTEFQFIGWDELGQHQEEDYTFLFSRLRKVACRIHKTRDHCEKTGATETRFELLTQLGVCACCGLPWFADGSHDNGYHKGDPIYVDGCSSCARSEMVPLRVRSTSNPPSINEPGASKNWIKERFSIRKQADGRFRGEHPKRFHMPSYASDNPFLNANEYAASLSEMSPVMREQMLCGDWDVMSDGLFRWQWIKKYTYRPNPTVLPGGEWPGEYHGSDFFILGECIGGEMPNKTWLRRQCICFSVCDPAASFAGGLNRDQIYVRGTASWTVISTFLLTPDWHLIWLDMVRFQKEIPSIVPALADVWQRLRPDYFVIEANGVNIGVEQYARAEGLVVQPYYPNGRGDPAVRATDAMVRMERGQIWLPAREMSWVEAATREIFTWMGRKDQTDDIISTLSMAAHEATRRAMSREQKAQKGRSGRPIPMASGGMKF